jgi:hypothetical protein
MILYHTPLPHWRFLDSIIALRPHSFFLGACISIQQDDIKMMDAAKGDRDKNKKDDAAAVSTTTERGPPPTASLYPNPAVGIGKVRCSLFVGVR